MVKCLCHVWELRLSLLLYWVLSDWIYDIGMQKTWIFVLEKGTSSIVCCVKIPTKRKKNSEPDFLKLYLVNQNNYHSIKQKLECYRCSTTTGASNAKEEGWAIQLSFAFHNTETTTYPSHLKIISGLFVNIELLNPWGTELLISIASFKVCTKHKPREY